MKLGEWADARGVSRQTAYAWFREGKLPVPAHRAGRLILVDAPAPDPGGGRTVAYARVSSADQKAGLDRQIARVTAWATASGMRIDQVVTEVGSALDGKRREFLTLLKDPSVTRIMAEHRDRIARFGVDYIDAALAAQDRKLIVVEETGPDDDLARDMTEILTSFCARRYRRYAAPDKAAAAMSAMGVGVG